MVDQTYALAKNGVYGQKNGVYADALDELPDSAIAHYDAQNAFGTGDDGTTISTWPDDLGNFDLTGGSPTVIENGINGNRSVQFDPSGDSLNVSFPSTESQPNTVFVVFENQANGGNVPHDWYFGSYSGTANLCVGQGSASGGNNSLAAGNHIEGNASSTNPVLVTGIFDGGDSVLRENGTQTESGDAGSAGLDGITLSNGDFDGFLGEILVCNSLLSQSEIETEEQRISDKWGFSL